MHYLCIYACYDDMFCVINSILYIYCVTVHGSCGKWLYFIPSVKISIFTLKLLSYIMFWEPSKYKDIRFFNSHNKFIE